MKEGREKKRFSSLPTIINYSDAIVHVARDVSEAFCLKIKEIFQKRAEQNKSNARFIDINLAKRMKRNDMQHIRIHNTERRQQYKQIERSIDPLPLYVVDSSNSQHS